MQSIENNCIYNPIQFECMLQAKAVGAIARTTDYHFTAEHRRKIPYYAEKYEEIGKIVSGSWYIAGVKKKEWGEWAIPNNEKPKVEY